MHLQFKESIDAVACKGFEDNSEKIGEGKMRFLGTSAGEGIPNPFCTCKVCENARRVKGKEVRLRSSFMLDETFFIDLGADYVVQAIMQNINLDKAEHVLFTHVHFDHINYTIFWERFCKHAGSSRPMNVYLTEEAYEFLNQFLLVSPVTEGREHYIVPENVIFVQLDFYKTYTIGNYQVTPLRGSHATAFEKNSANYLIERDGFALYYAVDSGYFLQESFQALKGKKLDVFIGECTFPEVDKEVVNKNSGHMDIKMFLRNLEVLYKNETITENTEIYMTHISGSGLTHEEIVKYMQSLDLPYKIHVAYDGMVI